MQGLRVTDVGQWVCIEDQQIGELAGLQASHIVGAADDLSAAKRRGMKYLQRCCTAGSQYLHFPVKPEALHLAVTADADQASPTLDA